LARSALVDHYKKEKGERGEARVENLEELVTATRNYIPDEIDGLDPLSSFLAHAALEAGDAEAEAWEDSVQLMSLHSAKGLEISAGVSNRRRKAQFPHQRSLEESGRLEEERRLAHCRHDAREEALGANHGRNSPAAWKRALHQPVAVSRRSIRR
jgi:DNA helicase-2/ATP-dependent DNA helicase PcrA